MFTILRFFVLKIAFTLKTYLISKSFPTICPDLEKKVAQQSQKPHNFFA